MTLRILLSIFIVLTSGLPADDQSWRLMYQQSLDLKEMGNYTNARISIQKAISESATFGHPDIRHALSLNEAGAIEYLLENPREAEQLLKRAIRLLEGLPSSAIDLADALNNLSLVYVHFNKRYAEAEKLQRRALDLVLRTHAPDNAVIGMLMTNLAGSRAKQGDRAGARALYEKVVLMTHRTDPSRVASLSNLGEICLEVNDPEGAQAHLSDAISSIESASGNNHPMLIPPLYTLGRVYLKQRRITLADAALKRALKLTENQISLHDPLLPKILVSLAEIRRHVGDKKAAKELQRQAKRLETESGSKATLNAIVHISELIGDKSK